MAEMNGEVRKRSDDRLREGRGHFMIERGQGSLTDREIAEVIG